MHQRPSGNWQANVILRDEEFVEQFRQVADEMGWSDSQTAVELMKSGLDADPRVQAVLEGDSGEASADD